jgi:DNA-binding transcriptional LysR family regulator
VDNLTSMSVFVRAADARSFTDVATQLGVSPSAVGKAIARLEKRLGVRLFHRSTRSITLTPEGIVYLESCRRIFVEIDIAEQELALAKGAPLGLLRVSLPMVGTLFMPVINRFLAAYPQITLDLDFSDKLVNIIEEGFDVVVRSGESTDSRLTARVLGRFSLQLVASPAYLRRSGTPLQPVDLLGHACLHHKYPSVGKLERWPLESVDDSTDLQLPVAAIASTIEPLIAMAESGLGITCVPDFAVRSQLADGTLVRILAEFTEHAGRFRAVWPSSRYLSPKVRAFVDFMGAHLSLNALDPTPERLTAIRSMAGSG